MQSTQFAQNTVEEQLERAHVRIDELKLINNKLNDQLIEEQQERHKSHSNTVAIDLQRDTLTVSKTTKMFKKCNTFAISCHYLLYISVFIAKFSSAC